MGDVRTPLPVKLFVGLLAADEPALRVAGERLAAEFGAIDLVSDVFDFNLTDYYRAELGDQIRRQFVSFRALLPVERLPDIKLRTNALEFLLSSPDGSAQTRRINIDPGYLTLSKVVLATTKDYSHRLYLRDGIYAEVTLHYAAGRWRPWEWTYRDYAAGRYFDFFDRVRALLKAQRATG